ncbi:MAG: hypothetical protein DRG83_00135 [Deltaproteobacteria bacterium]|nr:MAG: hypothetical protein DRG83_00135 [Deltaproteobacteria bacterium]
MEEAFHLGISGNGSPDIFFMNLIIKSQKEVLISLVTSLLLPVSGNSGNASLDMFFSSFNMVDHDQEWYLRYLLRIFLILVPLLLKISSLLPVLLLAHLLPVSGNSGNTSLDRFFFNYSMVENVLGNFGNICHGRYFFNCNMVKNVLLEIYILKKFLLKIFLNLVLASLLKIFSILDFRQGKNI